MEPECNSRVFDFWGRDCLGECVGNHVVCRAINELDFAIVNYPANEMEMHVNMFGVGVILVVFGEGNHQLIIREKCGGCIGLKWPEHLTDQ